MATTEQEIRDRIADAIERTVEVLSRQAHQPVDTWCVDYAKITDQAMRQRLDVACPCGATGYSTAPRYTEQRKRITEMGWSYEEEDDEWFCPECQEEAARLDFGVSSFCYYVGNVADDLAARAAHQGEE